MTPSDHHFDGCEVRGLRLLESGAQSVHLGNRHAQLEVSVLAPDVFRLRACAGSRLTTQRSWAVVKTSWPAVAVRTQADTRSVTLSTRGGAFRFELRTGAWRVTDRAGLEVLCAPARAMALAPARARVALRLAPREHLFGLGEMTGPFDKRGLVRDLWNIDVLGHASAIHPGLRSMYLSIPFLTSLRDGRAAGWFWDQPARQSWDLGRACPDRCVVTAEAPEIDLYLFLGPMLSEVVGRYTELTGRMPLPPRWALGYHQCRYSYESAARLEAVASGFRRRRIPCDALYLDIHHMDGCRVFSFGRSFSRPAALLRRLARRGFKVVTIVDPGVKDEPRFGPLRRGLALDAFVKRADGRADYLGEVWPGRVRFPDFMNARVRAWWGSEQSRLQGLGVAGFWNDMNEPSDFRGPGKTLDPRCRHDTDHGPGRHARVHNLYGMQMARASREGALAHRPDERPFVITRAGYAGVQRHALVWTGDNSSCWEHLADSLQMLLNLGLSGVAFCGSDVGGFLDDATGELLARWTQMAAFTPFFRNHSNIGTRAQEPWAHGPEVEAICRRYIELRYQLLPYLDLLFVQAHREGAPIMRPLAWHYQNDATAAGTGDQFMLGKDLLIAPVLRPGAVARSVYLPAGNWYDFWTGEKHRGRQQIVAHADLATLPVFVRAGAVIPMGPVRPFIGRKQPGAIAFHVWPGASGETLWYEDDGVSHAFERGEFLERRVRFTNLRRGGLLVLEAVESVPLRPGRRGVESAANGPPSDRTARGPYPSEVKQWRVVLRGARRSYRVSVNQKPTIGRFDPAAGVFSFAVANSSGPITARWW